MSLEYNSTAYFVALKIVQECSETVGNEELSRACQDIIDSLDCQTIKVPTCAQLQQCAEMLNEPECILQLVRYVPMNPSLPQAFYGIVREALYGDMKLQMLPSRLMVVLLFTIHLTLECLRNNHVNYVIPIARYLASAISDSCIRDHVFPIINSGFFGRIDTILECNNDDDVVASSVSRFSQFLTLGFELFFLYFTQ